MIQTQTMTFLGLDDAAEALGLHPNTLQARAKAGEIPGAKVGKEWRFLDVDLAEYMRSQYPANKLEAHKWLSTGEAKSGGTTSRSRGTPGLEEALGLPTWTKAQRRHDEIKAVKGQPRLRGTTGSDDRGQ